MKIDFGMDKKSFINEFQEKQFFIKRNSFNKEIFTWDNLNDLLFLVEPRFPYFKVFKNNKPLSEEDFIVAYQDVGKGRTKIRKDVLYRHMREGATLVLNRANRFSPALQKICNQISLFSGCQSLANGYLAFSGEGTFGNHWDTHDVFVVQLIGRKKWTVYRPTFELPLSAQTSQLHKSECPSVPVFEGILEQGDIMYIPRGWWHNALPQDESTFHVAVGLHSPKVVDYISWLTTKKLPELLACRQTVHNNNAFSRLEDAAEQIMVEIKNHENINEFLKDLIASEHWISEFKMEKFGNPEHIFQGDSSEYVVNSSYFSDDIRVNPFRLNGITLVDAKRTVERLRSVSNIDGQLSKREAAEFELINSFLQNDIISESVKI